DFTTLPQGEAGQRLMALRYIIANGEAWISHFAWQGPLRSVLAPWLQEQGLSGAELETRIQAELGRISQLVADTAALRASLADQPPPGDEWIEAHFRPDSPLCTAPVSDAAHRLLVTLEAYPELRARCREQLAAHATDLYARCPRVL